MYSITELEKRRAALRDELQYVDGLLSTLMRDAAIEEGIKSQGAWEIVVYEYGEKSKRTREEHESLNKGMKGFRQQLDSIYEAHDYKVKVVNFRAILVVDDYLRYSVYLAAPGYDA